MKNNWISIKDKLPKVREDVLVANKKEVDWRANYWSGERWELTPMSESLIKVTHWMPLPQPPKQTKMSLDITLKLNDEYVFEANITHNLNKMADAAGIYKIIWRPDELGIKFAKQIITELEKGLIDMILKPEHYKQFDASNGWGKYKDFIPWLADYLEACKNYPDSEILISR